MKNVKEEEAIIPAGAKLKEVTWKRLLTNFRKRIEESSKKLILKRKATDVKVEKKLSMMRMAMLQQMHAKLKQEIDTKFFLEMIELINRAEEIIEEYEHDLEDWLEFLEILEKKLEEEGMLLEDEELVEQSRRLKEAVAKLRERLEGRL